MIPITRELAMLRFSAILSTMLALSGGAASADTLKIGVLTDMDGPFAQVVGAGSVVAAKLAVEDMGGKVLGMPIEVISANTQNKPDIASTIARRWLDDEKVDVIIGGSSSAAGLAIQEVAREKQHLFLITDSVSSDFTGKACSPFGIHFTYDTYALASGTARAMLKRGGNTWFFLTVDYAFGHALERDASQFILDGGGKVLGEVHHPLNAGDFSSYLLQAQNSKAKVIGLANSSTDTVNAIKQAREFAILEGGQKMAALLMYIADVEALGLEAAQGLTLTVSFYWDLNDRTRAWSKRFMDQMNGRVPTMGHAGAYSAALHYLEAVKEAGTKDVKTVAAKMREMPVDDMYNDNVRIRSDGRVLHKMYLMQVKTPSESRYPHDDYHILAETPGGEAFRPMAQGGCPSGGK
jgi:branched-chain amino acid transport system substrate-binding protein